MNITTAKEEVSRIISRMTIDDKLYQGKIDITEHINFFHLATKHNLNGEEYDELIDFAQTEIDSAIYDYYTGNGKITITADDIKNANPERFKRGGERYERSFKIETPIYINAYMVISSRINPSSIVNIGRYYTIAEADENLKLYYINGYGTYNTLESAKTELLDIILENASSIDKKVIDLLDEVYGYELANLNSKFDKKKELIFKKLKV